VSAPAGVGVYLRGLGHPSQGEPAQAAQKARDHGIDFVALLAIWQNRNQTLFSNGRDPARLVRYAEAFRAAGVGVGLWGYPWAGRHHEYLNRLQAVTDACGPGIVDFWLHDPELGYKWGRATGAKEADVRASATALRAGAEASGLPQGVTSFGTPAGHPTLALEELGGFGFGSPQFYTAPTEDFARGFGQWRVRGWSRFLPSAPLYGPQSGARLEAYLSAMLVADPGVDGYLFWSWRQAGALEWAILERWAKWIRLDMCVE
jgi:hypothetical protein